MYFSVVCMETQQEPCFTIYIRDLERYNHKAKRTKYKNNESCRIR